MSELRGGARRATTASKIVMTTALNEQRTSVPVVIDTDGAQLVTVANAARLMGLSVRTLYGWVERGLVEVRYTAGGRKRVVVASLIRRDRNADSAP